MDSSSSSTGSTAISRLPRFTPRRPVTSTPLPQPSTSSVTQASTSVVKSAKVTPSISNVPEFKQPKPLAVQALRLASKKRYSAGKRGLAARSPSTARGNVVKRPVAAGGTTLGKRPPQVDNNVGPAKRSRILTERNPAVPQRKATTAISSESTKATAVKTGVKRPVGNVTSRAGGKARVGGGTCQENVDQGAVAGSSSSDQAKPKRKVQPWDIKGKLEMAEIKIRKLQEDLTASDNRYKLLEEQSGSAQETLLSLSNQLTEEKALSSGRWDEILTKTAKIYRLEEKLGIQAGEIQKKDLLISELNQTISDLKDQLQRLGVTNQDLVSEIDKLQDTRRYLHNMVQDLKGNIRVLCRVRPPTPKETNLSSPLCHIDYCDTTSVEIYKAKDDSNSKQKKNFCTFSFDRVFPANSTQEDIYSELEQLVQSCLDGYNVCVFAYGQTGSGKTYTMDGVTGDETKKGMIPRTVDTIFSKIEQLKQLGWEYSIETFFVEIYNEQIRDLLNYTSNANHEIRMVPNKKNEVFISNLRVETVHSQEQLNSLMDLARNNRFVASTVCNTHSSRSHFIMRISVTGTNKKRQLTCNGSISLVDLAGSERYEDNNTLDRRKETMNINKSLSSLANVILALKQKNDHVPYRVSKLTHLLMPCLGGSSKTLMIVNISPLKDCYAESVNSLRFANCVNQCHVVAKKNEKTTAAL